MNNENKTTNSSIKISAKTEVTADVTQPIQNLLNEPFSIIGNLFSAILYLPTRKLTNLYLDKKMNDDFNRHKQQLLHDTELETIKNCSKISPDNLRNPAPSEVIPPVEALDIYFDKPHYRTMLSRLLSSTFDSSMPTHPSFVDIIKKLTECDVCLLRDLNTISLVYKITVAKLIVIPEPNFRSPVFPSETLLLKFTNFGEHTYESQQYSEHEISNSIFNLVNVGIIKFDSTFYTTDALHLPTDPIHNIDNQGFQFVKEKSLYKELVDYYEPAYKISALMSHLIFTSIGVDFFTVCIE